jgi:prepilin-type N-terminal cleavage/methylation domain-containing protein
MPSYCDETHKCVSISSYGVQAAFTLIETILVIALISVMTALAVPNFNKVYRSISLQRTVNHLVDVMCYAQSQAIIKGQPYRLNFDPAFINYWVTQGVVSENAQFSDSAYRTISGKWGNVFVLPQRAKLSTDLPFIQFEPNGRIGQAEFLVCFEKDCLVVSTKMQSGSIDVIKKDL